MTDKSPEANPYESSPRPARIEQASSTVIPAHGTALSPECCGNLTLTSKIVRIASVVFGIGSLVSILQIWAAFRFYGFPDGWTLWHTLIAYRIVYTPCWLLLAWMLWKYATCLNTMADKGVVEVEPTMEQQAKVWLAFGLLLFVMLIGLAIGFSGALSTGIPQ